MRHPLLTVRWSQRCIAHTIVSSLRHSTDRVLNCYGPTTETDEVGPLDRVGCLIYSDPVTPAKLTRCGAWFVLSALVGLGACASPAAPSSSSSLTFSTDFRSGLQGWQFDVAHRGPICAGTPPLAIGELRTFGSPHESSGSGLFLQARCYFVFAFVKRAVGGLVPGQTYQVTVTVEIETDTPATACIPESTLVDFNSRSALGTVLYGAATSREPRTVPDGMGVQLEGGLLRSGFLGDISTSEKRCGAQAPLPIWEFRSHSGGGMSVTADASGQVWLTAGFVSDWGSIYLSRVSATFTRTQEAQVLQ